MLLSVALREARECYLSRLAQAGWSIRNRGDHPVRIKESMEEIRASEWALDRLRQEGLLLEQVVKERAGYVRSLEDLTTV